jgi:hypothetical protein
MSMKRSKNDKVDLKFSFVRRAKLVTDINVDLFVETCDQKALRKLGKKLRKPLETWNIRKTLENLRKGLENLHD